MGRRFVGRVGLRALAVGAVIALLSAGTIAPGLARIDDVPGGQSGPDGAGPLTKSGDLSHLVYTAQTGLVAHAISPGDGGILNSVATSFEVATVAGAGVELRVNGNVVPVKKLGRRIHFLGPGLIVRSGR